MKIQNKKSRSAKKKALLPFVLVVLFLVAGAGTYVYGFGGNLFGFRANPNQEIQDGATSDGSTELDSGNNLPEEAIETGEGKPSGDGSADQVDPDNAPDNTPTALDAAITAKNQNGDSLQIRTLIQEVASTGSCSLSLTRDGVTVTRTAAIQPLASSSTCKGFDIPVSELSKGAWNLVIDISANNKKAHLMELITIT